MAAKSLTLFDRDIIAEEHLKWATRLQANGWRLPRAAYPQIIQFRYVPAVEVSVESRRSMKGVLWRHMGQPSA